MNSPFAQIARSMAKSPERKPAISESQTGAPFQAQGEGRSCFVFDRNFDTFDLERSAES
jgi:hypothetical protein